MSSRQQTGGHKANLNNPNTSEESKQHSREIFDGESGQQAQSEGRHSHEGKNPGNGRIPNPNIVLSGTISAPFSTLFFLAFFYLDFYLASLRARSDGSRRRIQSHIEKPQRQRRGKTTRRRAIEEHVIHKYVHTICTYGNQKRTTRK